MSAEEKRRRRDARIARLLRALADELDEKEAGEVSTPQKRAAVTEEGRADARKRLRRVGFDL